MWPWRLGNYINMSGLGIVKIKLYYIMPVGMRHSPRGWFYQKYRLVESNI